MKDLNPISGNGRGTPFASIPFLQAHRGTGERWLAELNEDVPSLLLSKGDQLQVRGQGFIDCDSLYQLQGNTFARIQFWSTPGVLRVVMASGDVIFMEKDVIEALVCGRAHVVWRAAK